MPVSGSSLPRKGPAARSGRLWGPFGQLALVIASGAVALAAAARVVELPPEEPAEIAAPAPSAAPAPAPSASAPLWQEPAGEDEAPSCAVPDRGVGDYGEWQTLPVGRMRVPRSPPEEAIDLLIHFHGGEAASRVVAPEGLGLVIAVVDAGVGSQAYAEAFAGGEPLGELLATVGAALAPARLRNLVLSSWSAGYGAVREILREFPTVPNAVVLLDSVHAAYQPSGDAPDEASLEPFVAYANRAVAGEGVMVLTHSEIRPPGYASTSEVADYLIARLDGRRRYAGLLPSYGVEAKTELVQGNLSVRGYTGTDKEAHCAHLRMLGDILEREVLPKLAGR